MPEEDVTTVKITYETWKRLNKMKEPGDSFDDVIQRLFEQQEDGE